MKNLFILIIIAFILRLIVLFLVGPIMENDALEYYNNSINLTVEANIWGYTEWYERTPIYTLILYLTNQSLIIQILISVLSAVLLFKLNPIVGWIWAIYPQSIFLASQYYKETYLLFFIILSIYLLRNKKEWLILIIPIIMLGFVSYGIEQPPGKFMQNVWEMWKPSFYPTGFFNYLQMPFYIIIIFLFIKKITIFDPTLLIVISFTLVYGYLHGEFRYREPLIPLILLTVFTPINKMKYNTDILKSENFDKQFNPAVYSGILDKIARYFTNLKNKIKWLQ